MKEQYGEDKGESVFYASRNAGRIKGVDRERKARAKVKARKNALSDWN